MVDIRSKRIAILGANESIVPLINKAKDLGYETHVFAWKCGASGESIADFFYPISLEKKEEILEKCKEIDVIGVCSITSDFAAPVVNYVARNLGLVCNPEETEILARNKYCMREAFSKAGLYTPEFHRVASMNELDISKLKFPVIVKPTDRWSSKGVTRVNDCNELDNAIQKATEESMENKAIVEEFMDGDEYSAECICYKGKVSILAFTQKVTTGFPHYIESGHIQPAQLSEIDRLKISDCIKTAVKALKIENGAAHAEFKILKDGNVGIIEIGARMGGDCIGTYLTPLSTGQDYIKMVLEIACGMEPTILEKPNKDRIEIKFIMNKEDYDRYLEHKRKADINIIVEGEFDELFEKKMSDSSSRHGYYIFKI